MIKNSEKNNNYKYTNPRDTDYSTSPSYSTSGVFSRITTTKNQYRFYILTIFISSILQLVIYLTKQQIPAGTIMLGSVFKIFTIITGIILIPIILIFIVISFMLVMIIFFVGLSKLLSRIAPNNKKVTTASIIISGLDSNKLDTLEIINNFLGLKSHEFLGLNSKHNLAEAFEFSSTITLNVDIDKVHQISEKLKDAGAIIEIRENINNGENSMVFGNKSSSIKKIVKKAVFKLMFIAILKIGAVYMVAYSAINLVKVILTIMFPE